MLWYYDLYGTRQIFLSGVKFLKWYIILYAIGEVSFFSNCLVCSIKLSIRHVLISSRAVQWILFWISNCTSLISRHVLRWFRICLYLTIKTKMLFDTVRVLHVGPPFRLYQVGTCLRLDKFRKRIALHQWKNNGSIFIPFAPTFFVGLSCVIFWL